MKLPKLRKLPDFFIVGAMKSATTSLSQALEMSPDVYISPIKEPNYFCSDINDAIKKFSPAQRAVADFVTSESEINQLIERKALTAHIEDISLYEKLFQCAGNDQVKGECSVSYLLSMTAANQIARSVPSAKIIIVLRNPIERAYSHWLMVRAFGVEKDSFIEAIEKEANEISANWRLDSHNYLGAGMYYEQVKRYFDSFPKNQILVMDYEEVTRDFLRAVNKILQHIGVSEMSKILLAHPNTMLRRQSRFHRLNVFLTSLGIKSFVSRYLSMNVKNVAKRILYTNSVQKITDNERYYLMDLYREDIRNLGVLLGRDLSHWFK